MLIEQTRAEQRRTQWLKLLLKSLDGVDPKLSGYLPEADDNECTEAKVVLPAIDFIGVRSEKIIRRDQTNRQVASR